MRAVVLLGPTSSAQQAAAPFDGSCLVWLWRKAGSNTAAACVVRGDAAWQAHAARQLHWATVLFFLKPLSGEACGAMRSLLSSSRR